MARTKTACFPRHLESQISALSHAARGIQLLVSGLDPIGRKDKQKTIRLQEAALNFKEAQHWVEKAIKGGTK